MLIDDDLTIVDIIKLYTEWGQELGLLLSHSIRATE